MEEAHVLLLSLYVLENGCSLHVYHVSTQDMCVPKTLYESMSEIWDPLTFEKTLSRNSEVSHSEAFWKLYSPTHHSGLVLGTKTIWGIRVPKQSNFGTPLTFEKTLSRNWKVSHSKAFWKLYNPTHHSGSKTTRGTWVRHPQNLGCQ